MSPAVIFKGLSWLGSPAPSPLISQGALVTLHLAADWL